MKAKIGLELLGNEVVAGAAVQASTNLLMMKAVVVAVRTMKRKL